MKQMKTKRQQELEPRPTKLEVLREIDKREGLHHHKKYKNELYLLEKGDRGEERLLHYLEANGAPHWTVFRNVWLDYYGEFECDVLLVTHLGVHAFEVKNYSGKLELLNNQCLRNGQVISHNPFSQTQKSTTNLQEILNQQPQSPHVQGVLSFVGINNHVELHDTVSGIDVNMLNELQSYLRKLTRIERSHFNVPINLEAILTTLEPFEIGRPSKERVIPSEIKKNVRQGICCSGCNSFEAKLTKKYLVCPCGLYEPREEAIVRTICEYGVIYHQRNLTTTTLTDFFDGEISKSTVFRHLNKHFERIGFYNNTQYTNLGDPFRKIKSTFELKGVKYKRI